MIRILLCGCNGKMGRTITACAAKRDDLKIVAGLDINPEQSADFPVFTKPEDCNVPIDVIIDFSHPSSLSGVLRYACTNHIPAVIATTGLSDEQLADIRNAAQQAPLFSSANMSLGVNLLTELAKKAAEILGDSFDIEIIEKHHNQKIDAPSGTALLLAESVKDGLSYTPRYVYDRQSVREKRDPHDIGISSIRGGTIVGEHDVIFAGHDEYITLSHTALSKDIFAVGALNAAVFLAKQPNGYYTMKNMLA
ncbi:MAG: 4-hydroxy-tetrahydrodipicolinate reductase [Clostridia bacterium]|nr:4-hydroxy-tetrahydrodipicolinate reductase [Clostridia bacterium]